MEYRLRLRLLCEEFALAGRPRTLSEMYALWKRGLRNTQWEDIVGKIRYDSMRRRRWTELETIYAVERIAKYQSNEYMLMEATFVLKNEGNPTRPDFRVWRNMGPLFVYAHDDLTDHMDWTAAEANDYFRWQGVYLEILTPFTHIQEPHPADVGMQIRSRVIGEDPANEYGGVQMPIANEEEEEEEEEDPEEDPNWEEEGEAEPIQVEVDPNQEPIHSNMNFDQDLDIPDSHHAEAEDEQNPSIWRDIPIDDGNPREEGNPNAAPRPEEEGRRDEEEGMMEEARATADRIWQEAGDELRETLRRIEPEEEEELARPPQRRRMTVRGYLSLFARRDYPGSTSRNRRSTSSP